MIHTKSNGGPVGVNAAPTRSTEAFDLPPALAAMVAQTSSVNSGAYAPSGAIGTVPSNEGAAALDFRQQPTYAQGGEVGPGGVPVQGSGTAGLLPQGQAQAPMDPKVLEMHLQKFMREQPGKVNEIKQAIMQAMAAGEVTQQDLDMAEQLATVALQNPDMYPQVRQFAIQRGLAEEQELSMEYDQGLIFVLLLAVRAAKSGTQNGGNFSSGGEVTSGTGPTSDDVSIRVSKGEFVVPADVVKAKGTDFFEKLVNPKGVKGGA